MKTAQQAINKAYNNQKNFMTPYVIEYGITGEYAYELASGAGFAPCSTMYGVSVVTREGERTDESEGGFSSEQAARDYIDELATS
jgi:hypothetical protein